MISTLALTSAVPAECHFQGTFALIQSNNKELLLKIGWKVDVLFLNTFLSVSSCTSAYSQVAPQGVPHQGSTLPLKSTLHHYKTLRTN